MLRKHTTVLIYSLAHFLVDFACAFLLFEKVSDSNQWYVCLLIYNFCAFALQMPLGLLADRLNKNAVFAAIGCASVALAYVFGGIPLMAVILAGVGNGLFHIGGGIEILNFSTENPSEKANTKAYALGIFVSPGAFGIYLGTIAGKQGSLPGGIVVLALLITAAILLIACYVQRHTLSSDNLPLSFRSIPYIGVLLAVACLFLVVCLRSYVGMTQNFSWKGQGNWGLVLICAVVLGKMTGGFIADRIGAGKASVISLGLAAVLYLFSGNAAAGVLAVFFFNMTMPITLWAVARIMKGCKGFSFGLLTFGLFLGFAPVYLGVEASFAMPLGFAAAAVLSLIFLLLGLRKAVV